MTLTYVRNFLELEFSTSSFLVNVVRKLSGGILLLMYTSVAFGHCYLLITDLEVSDSFGVIRFPPQESRPSFNTKKFPGDDATPRSSVKRLSLVVTCARKLKIMKRPIIGIWVAE